MQTLELRSNIKARIGNALLLVYIEHIFFSHTIHNVMKHKFSKNPKLFIRLQINETILRELYAPVKK